MATPTKSNTPEHEHTLIHSLNLSHTHTSKNPSLAMSSSKKTWPPIMSKLACPLKIPKRFMFKKLMETSNSHIQAMEM